MTECPEKLNMYKAKFILMYKCYKNAIKNFQVTFLMCTLLWTSSDHCVLESGGFVIQCFGRKQQSEGEAWTEKPKDAETALGCTAHTRLAQQLLRSVSGWLGVHILGVHVCIYTYMVCLWPFECMWTYVLCYANNIVKVLYNIVTTMSVWGLHPYVVFWLLLEAWKERIWMCGHFKC